LPPVPVKLETKKFTEKESKMTLGITFLFLERKAKGMNESNP